MARALAVWGLGHLAIGDRRGWLLMLLQLAGIAAIAVFSAAFLEGSRDIVVFLALVVYLAIWGGQAIDAQRRAIALGGEPGGAIRILVLAPVAITALTVFWAVGGAAGSPAAVLQRYVSAWREREPASARLLFAAPPDETVLAATWQQQSDFLGVRLAALRVALGTGSGIDPSDPFGSLMFVAAEPGATAPGGTAPGGTAPGGTAPSRPGTDRTEATIAIDVVREATVHGTFFGLFPTASQETVPVERIGTVTLRALGQDPVLGIGRGVVWRILSVDLPAD